MMKNNNFNLIVSLTVLIIISGCKDKDSTKAITKNIIDSVFASGYVTFNDEYWVTANTEGFIQNSYIKEGDTVSTEQDLFQLSADVQSLKAIDAEINYHDALATSKPNAPKILQLKNQIKQAEKTLQLDKINYERYANLIVSNAVSRLEYDQANLQHEKSILNLEVLRESLIELENKVQLQVKNLKNQFDIQKAYQSDYLLESMMAGTVLEIAKNTGEFTKKGELLAKIGGGVLIAKLYIAEEDINKIELNQKVILELNTEIKKRYEGLVVRIYPTFNDTEQSFVIDVEFSQVMKKLISGTQIQANIIVSEKENALIIPSKYLIGDNQIQLENGKLKIIELGLITSDWIEVLSGLDKNTTIISPKN